MNKKLILMSLLCIYGLTSSPLKAETGSVSDPKLNEEYPQPGEKEKAIQGGIIIQSLQVKNAKATGKPIARGFHAKVHGCLKAKFNVIESDDPRTKFGLFAKPGSFDAWARFTNGKGTVDDGKSNLADIGDRGDDARGLAIKVMGLEKMIGAKKLLEDTKGFMTQDFLMTNQPSQIVPTANEFVEFAEAVHGGAVGLGKFFFKYPRAGVLFATYIRRGIDSVATEDYWSGTPYGLIDKAGQTGSFTTEVKDANGKMQAVKFMVKPCHEKRGADPSRVLTASNNYLGEELVERAAQKKGICYNFYLQFQKDPKKMPVEDASVLWDEEASKPVHVATLEMEPQSFNSEAQKAYCESLVFSPWHGLDSFRPIGSMNRARRFIYEMSSELKNHQQVPNEPSGFAEFEEFVKTHHFITQQMPKHIDLIKAKLGGFFGGGQTH